MIDKYVMITFHDGFWGKTCSMKVGEKDELMKEYNGLCEVLGEAPARQVFMPHPTEENIRYWVQKPKPCKIAEDVLVAMSYPGEILNASSCAFGTNPLQAQIFGEKDPEIVKYVPWDFE